MPQAEREIAWLQGFILAVRQIRGEMDINPSKRFPVLLKEPDAARPRDLASHAIAMPISSGSRGLSSVSTRARARGAAPRRPATAIGGRASRSWCRWPISSMPRRSRERLGQTHRQSTQQDLEKTRAQAHRMRTSWQHAPRCTSVATHCARAGGGSLSARSLGLETQLGRVRSPLHDAPDGASSSGDCSARVCRKSRDGDSRQGARRYVCVSPVFSRVVIC